MNSDVGSRAKLSDVPKLHELIEAQIRRAISERATWKVVLPGVTTVEEVKREDERVKTEAVTEAELDD